MTIMTFILGILSGYVLKVTALKISFKQKTIDNKIKIYVALIAIWVKIRNHVFHYNDANKWENFDILYSCSQTYIGEAFLLSDDILLLGEINAFNEKIARTQWSTLPEEEVSQIVENLKTEGLILVQRMKADIHQSTGFTLKDFFT